MQEKTLSKQEKRTSNIHSGEVGSVSYDIFGSPYQKTDSFLADDSLDFGYLGKPYNADTELYDYGFRDYSPEIARFSTVDPIRDGRNWYSYVFYETEITETLQRGLKVLQKENYITKRWRLIYGKNKIYIVAITMFY